MASRVELSLLNHAANSSEGGEGRRRSESEREGEFVVIYSTFQIDLEPYLYAGGKRGREGGWLILAFDPIIRWTDERTDDGWENLDGVFSVAEDCAVAFRSVIAADAAVAPSSRPEISLPSVFCRRSIPSRDLVRLSFP